VVIMVLVPDVGVEELVKVEKSEEEIDVEI
jgi:hypothetical protein